MIDIRGIRARITRMETLTQQLAREVELVRAATASGPGAISQAERLGYLQCLYDAIAGLDAGRNALVKAAARLDREAKEGGGR